MSEQPRARPSIAADAFAGAGVGLLLGTIVGLSTSPVVAIVVGALTSLLTVFLGLEGGAGSGLGAVRLNAARIGSLGLATVAGLGLGLYVRINNPLADTPEAQLSRWTKAFPEDPTLAKQLMIFERTGISPSQLQFGDAPQAAGVEVSAAEGGAAGRRAVLFSSLGGYDACARLDPKRFATTADALEAYTRGGVPDPLPKLAQGIAGLPAADQATAVAVTHNLVCALQREERE